MGSAPRSSMQTQSRSSRGIGECSNQYIAVQKLEMTSSTNSFHDVQPDRHDLRSQMISLKWAIKRGSNFGFCPGSSQEGAQPEPRGYIPHAIARSREEGISSREEGFHSCWVRTARRAVQYLCSVGFLPLSYILSSLLYPLLLVLLLLTFFFLCHWCFP